MFRTLKNLLVTVLCVAILLLPINAVASETIPVEGLYRHPNTGMIEDSGGESSEALGQSMVTKMLSDEGTFNSSNNMLELTFNLMNSISDVKIMTEKVGSQEFTSVNFRQSMAGDDIGSFQVELTSVGDIVRVEAFIEPMGRAVVFYVVIQNSTKYQHLISSASTETTTSTESSTEELTSLENETVDSTTVTQNSSDDTQDNATSVDVSEYVDELLEENDEMSGHLYSGLIIGGPDADKYLGIESTDQDELEEVDGVTMTIDNATVLYIFLLVVAALTLSGAIIIFFLYAFYTILINKKTLNKINAERKKIKFQEEEISQEEEELNTQQMISILEEFSSDYDDLNIENIEEGE